MELVSPSACPVASVIWQPRPGTWVLTVVYKATYLLRPGECPLAPKQEPLAEDDRHFGGAPTRSLWVARDLVPAKPGADVLLVGSVFAPERRPVRAVEARLVVAGVDKTIEVVADRTLWPDGSMREGPPFVAMPLVYERAAGGPGTWNPVGVRRDVRDAEGSVVLPNLQRPGASPANIWEPVGYGPIASTWPERCHRVGAAGGVFPFHDLSRRPLPEGMDLGFFNAAPRDQQVRALDVPLSLTLENLHPDQPRLVTTVPTAPPRAVLEGRPAGAVPIALRADTLWIDTDRELVTVTFRGMVPLQSAEERGRVVLSTDPEHGPKGPRASRLPAVQRPPPQLAMTADISLELRMGNRAALPFAPSEPPAALPAQLPSPPAVAASAVAAPFLLARAVTPAPSVFEASTAAAGTAPTPAEPVPPRAVAEPEPPKRAIPQEAIELVWYAPELVPRARRKAEWRALLDALERTPLDLEFDDPAFADEPRQIEDRREIFEILAHASPADSVDVSRCLRDDGKYVPALALFAGELELPFDELSALRATVTTASLFVGTDEGLRSAVQAAKEFLATPGLMSAPAVAEGLTRRIDEAFAAGKRPVGAGYLEAQRERVLLEQRQYQRRAVLGGKHLRGLFKLGGGEAPSGAKPGSGAKAAAVVPAYLPDAITNELPLYPRFGVRLVAEVRLAVDRYESSGAALRVMALARTMAPPRA